MEFMTIHNKTKRMAFLIGMFLACTFLVGWADNWGDIQNESAKITSVSAHFSQEKHIQILTRPLVSKGRFYFQAPDSVRWEYTSPVKSILTMHNGNIKRYVISGKGIAKDAGSTVQSMQVVLQEISRWSRGKFTENEYFSATLKEGKERQIILTPREKELAAMISRIVITLSADRPGVLKSVKIVESEGNYTLFEFTNVLINEKISET
jgi:outer membrane lipoprotein-sorting protein